MDDAHMAGWRLVDADRSAISWPVVLGDPEGVTYLSRAGRDLSRRMAHDLTAFFGPSWLSAVMAADGKPPKVGHVFRNAPSLALSPAHAVDAYVTMVRWWASIIVNRDANGMAQVRRDARANHTEQRFLHTLTMLRLGAVARMCGMTVVLEPTPGDLRLVDQTVDTEDSTRGPGRLEDAVTIEVIAMGAPLAVETFNQDSGALFAHLEDLAQRHTVHFDGELPELDSDLVGWRERTASAAATVARLGVSIAVRTDGRTLQVHPGDATIGTELEGPKLEADVGTRVQRAVRRKGDQVSAAADAWIWMENYGAVDALTVFHQMAGAERVRAFAGLVRPALVEFHNVHGLTFATESVHAPSSGEGAETASGSDRLLQVPLWPHRTRSSISVEIDAHAGGVGQRVSRRLVEAEAAWLDAALLELVGVRAVDLVVEADGGATPTT